MPGSTETFKVPFAEGADAPPSVPTITKSMADRLEELFGAIDLSQLVTGGEADNGKLVIVNSGAAAYKAMSGDGTIDQTGNFQLGAGVVGASELATKAVVTSKLDDGAVTEAKIDDGNVTSRKAALTVGGKSPSSNLELSSSYQDLPDTTLEITPSVASVLLVVASFTFSFENVSGKYRALGTVRLDSTDQAAPLAYAGANINAEMDTPVAATAVYGLSLTAAAHTIKMRAKYDVREPGGRVRAYGPGSAFLYALVAS